jgi:hypothetical protein
MKKIILHCDIKRKMDPAPEVNKSSASKFCAVAPNIFSIIITVFFCHTKMCTSSNAPSRKHQVTQRFTGHFKLWAFRMKIASCHLFARKIWMWFIDFWKICGHLSHTFHTFHLYRLGKKSLYTKHCVSHTDNTTKFPDLQLTNMHSHRHCCHTATVHCSVCCAV